MHERPPATIVDIDDELRSALEDALRSHGQVVIATREDESSSGEGTSDILVELPSDLALLEPVTDYLTKRIEQAWSVPVDRNGEQFAVDAWMVDAGVPLHQSRPGSPRGTRKCHQTR